MPNKTFSIERIKNIIGLHDNYWEAQRDDLRRWKSVYECNFWEKDQNELNGQTMITIETAEGYTYVESFQASLFAKNPAVVIQEGMKKEGDAEKSEIVVNDFLLKTRKEVENCSRLALIYPNAFVKFVPTGSEDIFDMVTSVPVVPWEIIVDKDAPRWSEQNYVGHSYWITVEKATELFGAKKYDGQPKEEFFHMLREKEQYVRPGELNMETKVFDFIRVVEIYDLQNDKLYWWSPNYQHGDKLLDKAEFIPFRDYKDDPVVPISPLYYNYIPDQPLLGYSAIKRVYDQLMEQNIIRTFQANAVRKASRQWLVKKGKLDEEQKAQLFSGIDGLAVEVELEDNEGLGEVIQPVPHTNVPAEVQHYYAEITKDKDKGSILAPFTRGEATKASATESSALIFYNSSEIGRLARERDALIEHMAGTYLAVLAVYVGEAKGKKKSTMIYVDKKSYAILPEDLLGDFNVFSSDLSSTPMSEVVKKGEFFQNVELLLALGVPQEKIKAYAVKLLELPEDFLETPELPAAPAAAPEPDPTLPVQGDQAVLEQAALSPSPANVDALLGAGPAGIGPRGLV